MAATAQAVPSGAPPLGLSGQAVEREACQYTSCYCEENVFLLLRQLHQSQGIGLDCLFVVFISNPDKHVPLWRQRSGNQAGGLVIWDYHVLLMQRSRHGSSLVWDLDSTLPFPSPFPQYVTEALGHPVYQLPAHLTRLFRVVPAATFLQHFASDRSHMLSVEGSWQEAPPSYPCIIAPNGATHTLPQYTEMPPFHEACSSAGEAAAALRRAGSAEDDGGQEDENLRWGVVLTQPVFLEWFGGG